ncbi:MAG: hypothetical protein EOP83_19270 [Verrucomicrobiaceae bacterium]|nr:MAG: hypothetical protein EOP83_19270 [Verrucomicrobiaceae bacterium]
MKTTAMNVSNYQDILASEGLSPTAMVRQFRQSIEKGEIRLPFAGEVANEHKHQIEHKLRRRCVFEEGK